jgi:serine/threonine protein kinase
VAGILHRDISIGNILLNPGGADGNRGILIDFDHAIRVGDTSPYSTKASIVGSFPLICFQEFDSAISGDMALHVWKGFTGKDASHLP